MEQVEQICQEIVLINQGRNVLQGDVHSIKQDFKNNLFEISYSGILPESLQAEDDANEDYSIIKNENNRLTIKVSHDSASNLLLNYLMKNGVYINGFNEILPSLNEIFIRQVGKVE
jgi:ABC-2 type transport system ATP-binding protein